MVKEPTTRHRVFQSRISIYFNRLRCEGASLVAFFKPIISNPISSGRSTVWASRRPLRWKQHSEDVWFSGHEVMRLKESFRQHLRKVVRRAPQYLPYSAIWWPSFLGAAWNSPARSMFVVRSTRTSHMQIFLSCLEPDTMINSQNYIYTYLHTL